MEIEKYEVQLTETAIKSLKKISKNIRILIFNKIEELANSPINKKNVKKLVEFDVSYRMRVGDYRVLFERNDSLKIIEIVDIR